MKQNRTLLLVTAFALGSAYGADEFRPVSLQSEINGTQPMIGLVFWSSSEHRTSSAISMEFAYLGYDEVGFGLWAEYHVYDPGEKVGVNFPKKVFQAEFMRHMAKEFKITRWLISKDAHVAEHTPFQSKPELVALPFGIMEVEELVRHSAACGYRFKVERFAASDSAASVTIANTGVAPLYYDAFPAVNGVRAAQSLARLPSRQCKNRNPTINETKTPIHHCYLARLSVISFVC